MLRTLLALAIVAASITAYRQPAAAWTIQECTSYGPYGPYINPALAPDCSKYLPPPTPTTTNNNSVSNNVSLSSTIASGAVSNVVNAAYPTFYEQPTQPILAGCDSSAALNVGINAQAVSGAFLSNGVQYGGTASVTIPIGRRAAACDYHPALAAAAPPQVIVLQQPAPAPVAPTIEYHTQTKVVPYVEYPACAVMSAQRKAVLLSKTNPHGVYKLARSHNSQELHRAISELTKACVDFSVAIDG